MTWTIEGAGAGPLIATAIHDGHDTRAEITERFALPDSERLREEDPGTAAWTTVAPVRVVAHRSRFELDLNRPREKAIYRKPEDAWGLSVWERDLPDEVAARSLVEYDRFYADIHALLTETVQRYGAFVVLDLHTYNHRRDGPTGPIADPHANPEVNVGTATLLAGRDRWTPLIQRFRTDLRAFDFLGRHLDVRENVKFRGGEFARWIHQSFPGTGCVLSVEFKKFFMDEWSGVIDAAQHEAIRQALAATVPGLHESLAAAGAP